MDRWWSLRGSGPVGQVEKSQDLSLWLTLSCLLLRKSTNSFEQSQKEKPPYLNQPR